MTFTLPSAASGAAQRPLMSQRWEHALASVQLEARQTAAFAQAAALKKAAAVQNRMAAKLQKAVATLGGASGATAKAGATTATSPDAAVSDKKSRGRPSKSPSPAVAAEAAAGVADASSAPANADSNLLWCSGNSSMTDGVCVCVMKSPLEGNASVPVATTAVARGHAEWQHLASETAQSN